MLITSAPPKAVIKWFQHEDTDHDVLCLLLATSQKDREFAGNLVDEFLDMDAAMGAETAFIFFHPQTTMYSPISNGRALLMGEDLSRIPVTSRLSGTYTRIADLPIQAGKDEIASHTARAASMFREMFDLDYSDLPCLIMLVKGRPEAYVISTKGAAVRDVCEYLAAIARIARGENHRIRHADFSATRLEEQYMRLERVMSDFKNSKGPIGSRLQSLLNKHAATVEDRKIAARFVTDDHFEDTDLNRLFDRLSFTDQLGRRGFRRLRKSLATARDLQQKMLSATGFDDNDLRDIEILQREIEERRERITKTLAARRHVGSKVILPIPRRMYLLATKFAETVNTWGDFIEKVKPYSDIILKLRDAG
jgi:hypothetical protein